jgi:uncharacterized protein with PQ loop repeat
MEIAQNFSNSLARDFKSQTLFNKLPQIFTIHSEKSVSGLSFTSFAMEALSLTVTITYALKTSLPYLAYEEALYNVLQSNLYKTKTSVGDLITFHSI